MGDFDLEVTGLDGMIRDFERLESGETIAHAHRQLGRALRTTFDATQFHVPTGTGDERRPAGALRDSGRFDSVSDGDMWTGEVKYGHEGPDPAVNYAVWARWKHFNKTGDDFIGDAVDETRGDFARAMDSAFTEVWPGEDRA